MSLKGRQLHPHPITILANITQSKLSGKSPLTCVYVQSYDVSFHSAPITDIPLSYKPISNICVY